MFNEHTVHQALSAASWPSIRLHHALQRWPLALLSSALRASVRAGDQKEGEWAMAVWARRGTEATRLATSRRAEVEKKTEGCATGMHWILIPLELIVLFEKFEEG